jgi:PAS domain S-box-containing protein
MCRRAGENMSQRPEPRSTTLGAERLRAIHAEPEEASYLVSVLSHTADAMVAIDLDGRILGWNTAAEGLFGYTPQDVMGRPCNEVLDFDDRCGNAVCDAECSLQGTPHGEGSWVVPTREVLARTGAGRRLWLSMTTVLVPPSPDERCRRIHLMRQVGVTPELEEAILERLTQPKRGEVDASVIDQLTLRETEVLRLLADGLGTQEIADQLFVSSTTARNHVQHILSKLDCHTRLEAVALALRNHI